MRSNSMKNFAVFFVPVVILCITVSAVVGQEPTAEDYMSFFKYYEGEWECAIDDGRDATMNYTLSPNGKCFVLYLTIDGKAGTHAIEGYDPSKKCWKNVSWYAEGGHGEVTFILDAVTLKAGPIGKTIEGRWTRCSASGEEKVSTIAYEFVDENEWKAKSDEWMVVVKRAKQSNE
jgi:hypothetical protein